MSEDDVREPLMTSEASVSETLSFREKYDNFEWNNPEKGVYYIRNVCHIAFGFFLAFTAFNGIQNLSTSILAGALGKISPALLYIVFTINCLFGPSLVNKLGIRGSLMFGFTCIALFGAAYLVALLLPKDCHGAPTSCNTNFMKSDACTDTSTDSGHSIGCTWNTTTNQCTGVYTDYEYCDGAQNLRWGLVLSSAVLFGFAASPTWIAQGAYMTTNAQALFQKWGGIGLIEYDESSGDLPVMGFLNGILWMMLQLTQVTGNIMPSAMTSAGAQKWEVFVVYLVFAGLGLLLIFSLRPMPVEKKPTNVTKDVTDMLGLWTDPRLFLLIPIIMYNGLEQGWIWGDFTATIVRGSLGSTDIGFVMTVFGVCDALFSFAFGKLSDSIGRFAVILMGCVAQLLVAALVIFKMGSTFQNLGNDDDNPSMPGHPGWVEVMVMAALWAVGDAALNTQLYSIISETFGDKAEAGFANFKLFQSLSVSLSFLFPIIGISYVDRSLIFSIICLIGLLCLAILEYGGMKGGAEEQAAKRHARLDLNEDEDEDDNGDGDDLNEGLLSKDDMEA